MATVNRRVIFSLFLAGTLASSALAQFVENITGFETDRDGNALSFQPVSYGDLQVVVFQDPAEADVTAAHVVSDPGSLGTNGPPANFSSEESFVANFTGDFFFGANGSDQFLDIRFEWADATDANRWVLVETLQSPILGDPSLHLNGVVRMNVNLPDCSAFEFGSLIHSGQVGVALLVRETGNNVPQGLRDNNPDGDLEFVGVSSVAGADTANPVPVPSTFVSVSDGDCSGSNTTPGCPGTGADWICLEFDLDAIEGAGQVIGWSFNGGDGELDATTNGDGVNRGVLAGLVITPAVGNTTSEYVELLIDNLEFEAPVVDPTYAPRLGTPIIENDDSVRVNDVLSSSTNVRLEIDRAGDPVGFTEVYNQNPAGALFMDFTVPALGVGDQLRANQTNPSGTSDYSVVITVNPPAAFSCTLTLDEDGNGGVAPADFEFVGATGLTGGAPQGHPVFYEGSTWQKVEFSLIPGAEPVIDFAGGNGALQPNGGNYNIDAIWFSIDPTGPNAGPYEVYVDHVYYIDATDNEVLISNAEASNPFPSFRGQSTVVGTSALSTNASFDGLRSDRIAWTWPDTALSNTVAPFRPGGNFPDSAKAVGFWVFVAPEAETTVRRPAVLGPVVGAATAVSVDLTTNGVTEVELFANGESIATVTNPATDPVVIDTSASGLALGDELTATQTRTEGTSDPSFPRRTTVPQPPRLQLQPITDLDESVTVFDVYNIAGSSATLVTVLANGTPVGTADPAGATSVAVNISSLTVGDEVTATQEANGLTSDPSAPSIVVSGDADCVVIYRVDFETDQTANWTVNAGPADEAADFFFDYSTVGIPQAPNSRTSTARGMKLQANLTSATFGGFSVSPTGQSFTGDYTLAFDWWANFNGPFPGGGNGSTNLSTFGIGTAGATPQWPGGAQDSVWFAATGDGGSVADWRAYSTASPTSYPDGSPVYAAPSRNNTHAYYSVFGGVSAPAAQTVLFPNQTGTTNVGSGGMTWHEVTITKNGTSATWRVDGVLIASIDLTTVTLGGDNILFGHSDINATSSTDPNAPAMLFTLIDNVRVLISQEPPVNPGDWDQDGDVDLEDAREFSGCVFGPGVLPSRDDGCIQACLDTFDFDFDVDVDLDDFADFELLIP